MPDATPFAEITATITSTVQAIIQAAPAAAQPGGFSLDSNWALVVLTAVLVGVTTWYALESHGSKVEMRESRRLSEENLAELRKQHLDHQEQYRAEKKALLKTYVTPIRWTIHERAVPGKPNVKPDVQSTFEIQLQNLGPGPAKDIEVLAVRKQGDRITDSQYGFFPGLVAGAIEWLALHPPTAGQLEAWAVNTWGFPPPDLSGQMVAEVRCKTILDEAMAPVRKPISHHLNARN